ncbi:hypothetical protein CBM2592_A130069 [Cupriavidus taiwanensis]|nr:hypothetical protein CBM2588_A110070 [Cupriavidus taiwanensis]SOY44751.1 hypothetical protein CBM2592_A130069 [Cupriavidus taiwanensis]SOY80652.1 hypothetical protein CBM2591_A170031 [Cupriavidus taiwanensis]SOZ52379.1 hypothetical protein CBM2617_A150033 [Cupriavidus taiwanensis]SOZ77010.1 hypothetical protein CBM2622_A140070 [Cupriavidus taiwanensis]
MPAIDVPGIALRPVADSDETFLACLYASTRETELRRTGWSEAQRAAFLAMQFNAQQRAYRACPDAEFLLMLRHGEPIGRLYLQHNAGSLHVIDLSLLPGHQNRGHRQRRAGSGAGAGRECGQDRRPARGTAQPRAGAVPAARIPDRAGPRVLSTDGLGRCLPGRP